MKVTTLALILKAMIAATLIGALLFFLLWCDRMTDVALGKYVLAFAASLLLWHMVIAFVPVRCDRPGCSGRMRHHWLKESDGEYRLQYICQTCGEVHEMNISFTIGSGDAW